MKRYRVTVKEPEGPQLPEGSWIIDRDGDWWMLVGDDQYQMCSSIYKFTPLHEDMRSWAYVNGTHGPVRDAGYLDVIEAMKDIPADA